jgi:ubiquitin-conjugating enzyme E2 G1
MDRCIANLTFSHPQLLSVISLLSSETPNLDSPANVDAAKEVRTDFAGPYLCLFRLFR